MSASPIFAAVATATTAWSPPHPDEVTALPGLATPLRSKLFSGYLRAEASGQTFYSHYVLTESRGNPSADPLVLWQQGGPGSSGFGFGYLAELGPYLLDSDSLNASGTLPKVFEREYSWDGKANLLLFEHPPGTGFSYCVDAQEKPTVCTWNDQTQAEAFYATLLAFYRAFPLYEPKPLSLIGESYAGLLLPFLAAEIYRHPTETPAKRLRSLAVGNGCPGTAGSTPGKRGTCNGPYGSYDTQHVLELAAGHSSLPRQLWSSLQEACGFPCAAPTWSEACNGPFTPRCSSLIAEADAAIGPFNIYNFYDSERHHAPRPAVWPTYCPRTSEPHLPCPLVADCGDGNQVGTLLEHMRRFGAGAAEAPRDAGGQQYPCGTGKAAVAWANLPAVRDALHMHPQSFYGRPWSLQAGPSMNYTTYTGASFDLYPGLLQRVNVTIYNGDVDACVPYNSNADWVDALAAQQGYARTVPWRPWLLGSVPAGYLTSYAADAGHSLRFVTVKESGHMVPQYQPQRAFEFFSRWLEGAPF